MTRYRVFLGAPTTCELNATNENSAYQWQTFSVNPEPLVSYTLPPAALEEASRRISKLYANIDFKDHDEDPASEETSLFDDSERTGLLGGFIRA
ncbi:hypothetical protein NM688_g6453 [Phlebia brevispora]|uniref:Uncharacterized protein n=1 Tax=Phlebia brevispora TaxID=194682 RepID=A0ACC1SFX0_9APHY|nr:hypothetical protein NM688_g6453 [Phlebia brevispora]